MKLVRKKKHKKSKTRRIILSDLLYRIVDYFVNVFNSLKYAFQRLRKGYCDKDISEIDTWFLTIMPKMLKELKQQVNSDPDSFCAEIFVGRHGIDNTRLALNEWNKSLDCMSILFEKAGGYSHYCFLCEDARKRRTLLDEAFTLFSKYFNDLWR